MMGVCKVDSLTEPPNLSTQVCESCWPDSCPLSA